MQCGNIVETRTPCPFSDLVSLWFFSVIVKEKNLKEKTREKENKGCHMLMEKGLQTYIGFVSDGKEGVLQGPNSDVQLHIPQGVYGLTIGCVCTDNSTIREYVPENECIVAPMVEFYSFSIHESIEREPYVIRIPHCLSDDSDQDNVKVRKVNTRSLDQIYRHTKIPHKRKSANIFRY